MLLLEAGGSDDVLEVQIPAGLYKTWRTRLDWNYTTEPQPGLDGRKLFWPRGKLLGGSSSINAMIYIRGAAADYDEWAQLTGDPSWSYEHVLPLFRRMEDNARGADRFHGVGGPLRVEDLRSPHPWTRAVDPVRRRRRLPAQRRLQRRHPGGRRPVPGHPEARTALVVGRRLPAPGRGAGPT